jgi:hypothetical protein
MVRIHDSRRSAAFEMNTPTPYLDCIILASAAYPSGFSYSLFVAWRGTLREVSTAFLGVLVLPYLAVTSAVWALRPAMLTFRESTAAWLAVAVLLAPVALLIEHGIHTLASYRANGRFPRAITLQPFWRRRLSPADHLLLGLVAVGEEIFYRMFWLGVLLSFDLPLPLALAVSSAAYGVNHLAFGAPSVVSKTASGFLYGSLYLFGGQSIWLPIVTHGIQNLALFKLAK